MSDPIARLDALRRELTVIQTALVSNSRVGELEIELAKAQSKHKALERKLDKVCRVMIDILNDDEEASVDVVTGVVVDEDLVDEEEAPSVEIRCAPCDKKFSAPRYLKRHNNKVHRGKGTTETLSSSSSSSSSSSDEERLVVRNHTLRTGKTYTCRACGNHYSALCSLKRHMHQKHR